jgi:hypothetical protein
VPGFPVRPDGCLDIIYSRERGLTAIGAMTAEQRYGLSAGVMLQTRESVRRDEPRFAPKEGNVTALFIEVDDFEDVRKRLEGYPIVMGERTTFYGMREIGVFEPGGHTVVFAARAAS